MTKTIALLLLGIFSAGCAYHPVLRDQWTRDQTVLAGLSPDERDLSRDERDLDFIACTGSDTPQARQALGRAAAWDLLGSLLGWGAIGAGQFGAALAMPGDTSNRSRVLEEARQQCMKDKGYTVVHEERDE